MEAWRAKVRARMVVEAGARMNFSINCDAVDVKFKLRSPPYITFDMNACKVDSKIKRCTIL